MIFILLVLLIVGGFSTLAPIARRLPDALDAWMAHRKEMAGGHEELQHLASAIHELQSRTERIEDQMDRIAERQDFMERLVEGDTSGSRPEA